MSDIANGIIGVLEARGGTVHRLDIMGDLPTFKQATVDYYLSQMSRNNEIRKISKGFYALGEVSPAPPKVWQNPQAAPFARVRSLIEDQGPVTKAILAKRLEGVQHLPNVIREMVADGTIHVGHDGLVKLGPHPAHKAPRTGQQRWSEGRDPRPTLADDAEPNTPSEEARDAGAPATTEVPEVVATPTCAGDAPVVSAAQESPPPAMGPVEAFAEADNADPDGDEPTFETNLTINAADFYCQIAGNGLKVLAAIEAVCEALGEEEFNQ